MFFGQCKGSTHNLIPSSRTPCPVCNRAEAFLITVFINIRYQRFSAVGTYLLWRKYKGEKELYPCHRKGGVGVQKFCHSTWIRRLRRNVQAQVIRFCREFSSLSEKSSLLWFANFSRFKRCFRPNSTGNYSTSYHPPPPLASAYTSRTAQSFSSLFIFLRSMKKVSVLPGLAEGGGGCEECRRETGRIWRFCLIIAWLAPCIGPPWGLHDFYPKQTSKQPGV